LRNDVKRDPQISFSKFKVVFEKEQATSVYFWA